MANANTITSYDNFAVGNHYFTTGGHKVSVMESIAEGGFGKVFKCSVNDNARAAKVVQVRNQRDKVKVEKEVGFLESLSSEFVPTLYRYIPITDGCILEQDLIGTSLNNMIQCNPNGCSFEETRNITVQLLSALKYIHSQDIIHCDIKPHNICIELSQQNELKLKIIDFGLAKTWSELMEVGYGVCFGTLNYESPEVLFSLKLSNKLDIWAAGLTIAEVMTGHVVMREGNKVDMGAPFAAQNVPLFLNCINSPAEQRPPRFTNIEQYILEDTKGNGWSPNNKEKFVKFVCTLLSPDCLIRPSAEDALKTCLENMFSTRPFHAG